MDLTLPKIRLRYPKRYLYVWVKNVSSICGAKDFYNRCSQYLFHQTIKTQALDQSTMFLHLTFMFWRASRRIDAGNLQLVQAALQKQLNANQVEF